MFALSVAVIVSIIFSNRMIRSIRHVTGVAISLSKGDLTKRCKVDGHYEIGELSEALNTTTENLRTTMASISESANVVAKNSEVMLVANTDIQNAVQEVSDNNVQSVAAIEEMTATSKDIANNIAETAQTSEEMTRLANEGIVSSKTTKDSVENLVSNLDKTSIVVSQVREESSKIESILDVIRGISEQTNLLALNAAIEAAAEEQSSVSVGISSNMYTVQALSDMK